MSRPDFFIVGAPKCGTTALYSYLRRHPNCFMPGMKEPCFFAHDILASRPVRSEAEYLGLFTGATAGQRTGEASTAYIYSPQATVEINRFNPSARIIILVRNPVELIPAFHNQQLYQGNETIHDLAAALRADRGRTRSRALSARIGLLGTCSYLEVGKLSAHVRRYLDAYGARRVHVIVHDDMKRSMHDVYTRVLRFLDLPDVALPFDQVNRNKVTRSTRLHAMLLAPPPLVQSMVQRVVPKRTRERVFVRLRAWNTRYAPRAPLPADLRGMLRDEFAQEVRDLGALLGRDLTHWTDPSEGD